MRTPADLPIVKRKTSLFGILPVLFGLVLFAAACGSDSDTESTGADDTPVTISDPWSRQPADGQTRTAAYGVVSNPTDEDVRIVAASSPISDTVELHITTMDDDGAMSMQEVEEGFVVPAGGEFVFEPGGPHIMVLDIDSATYPASVEFSLDLEGADALNFTAEVRESTMQMDQDMEMDGPEG